MLQQPADLLVLCSETQAAAKEQLWLAMNKGYMDKQQAKEATTKALKEQALTSIRQCSSRLTCLCCAARQRRQPRSSCGWPSTRATWTSGRPRKLLPRLWRRCDSDLCIVADQSELALNKGYMDQRQAKEAAAQALEEV